MRIFRLAIASAIAGALSACSGGQQGAGSGDILALSLSAVHAEPSKSSKDLRNPFFPPLVSPDGRNIIQMGGGFCLYSLSEDLTPAKVKCGPFAGARTAEGGDFSWNPSGTRVLAGKFVATFQRNVDTDISFIDAARGEEIVLTEDGVTGQSGDTHNANRDFSPVWTSDNHVAFVRFAKGAAAIMTMSVTDSTPQKLLDVPRYTHFLAASPNGKRLAYVETDKFGDDHVWVVDAAGGIPAEVKGLSGRDVIRLRFSPDGGRLIGCEGTKDPTVTCRMEDIATGALSDIAGGLQLYDITWSPTGDIVAYTVAPKQQATAGTYLEDVKGGGTKVIAGDTEPAFVESTAGGGTITWTGDILTLGSRVQLTFIRLKY